MENQEIHLILEEKYTNCFVGNMQCIIRRILK